MNLLMTPEFKVGILVLIASGIIATMSLKVSEDPSYLGGSKAAWFLMDDASGLVKNSNVKTAGISVGIIKDIVLENGQAKVQMLIRKEVPVFRSARIEIRPNGILGDKHVEIISGDPKDAPLRDGDQILVVDDRASVDRLISEVSKITKSLSAVAENIKAATEGDTDKPLGRIVANIERITSDISEFTNDRKGQIGEIVDNIHNVTSSIDDLVNDDTPDGFKAAWKDALHSLRRIEKSLKNVEDITDKVNRGEGTIGRLVNDEKTVEELNTAIESVNGFLDSANKLQTAIDFHSDYAIYPRFAKSYLSINVQPGLDRYYEFGVVDDPHGVVETVTTRSSVGGGSTTELREEKRFQGKLKFTALFAKNFYNFTVRGGVMESAGGLGFDYHMLKRSLRLSVEAFEFSNVHLRAYLRYNLFRGIYANAGIDDALSKTGQSSAFVGAGIFMTNDDLKLLLSKSPIP